MMSRNSDVQKFFKIDVQKSRTKGCTRQSSLADIQDYFAEIQGSFEGMYSSLAAVQTLCEPQKENGVFFGVCVGRCFLFLNETLVASVVIHTISLLHTHLLTHSLTHSLIPLTQIPTPSLTQHIIHLCAHAQPKTHTHTQMHTYALLNLGLRLSWEGEGRTETAWARRLGFKGRRRAHGKLYLLSQISIDDLVLQVSFATFC